MVKIKLNNNEYFISDSKLTPITAEFITYLGKISGNGMKVVVDGVEYGIDASKLAGAVEGFEEALGELSNPEAPDNVAVLDEATLDHAILA